MSKDKTDDWYFTLRTDGTLRDEVDDVTAYVGQLIGSPKPSRSDATRLCIKYGAEALREERAKTERAATARKRRRGASDGN